MRKRSSCSARRGRRTLGREGARYNHGPGFAGFIGLFVVYKVPRRVLGRAPSRPPIHPAPCFPPAKPGAKLLTAAFAAARLATRLEFPKTLTVFHGHMNISFTPEAVQRLNGGREGRLLRIAFTTGCGGSGYRLSYESEPYPGDVVVEQNGIPVALDG